MIRLENISKVYQQNTNPSIALENISLTINRSEMVAIMGPSGSGKSTLLNIIGCMDTATSGYYWLDETEVTKCKKEKQEKIRKEKISFVFQHFALMDQYTAFENVEVPLVARNVRRKKRKEVVEFCLNEMGILELKKRYPSQMSGGQKQRTAIARAIAAGTPIILADEPTGALDQKTGQEVVDVLKKINKSGTTVILVTHDLAIAKQAGRIVSIVDGKIVNDTKVTE